MAYINPNNPVFISYSWADKNNPGIEQDVDHICKLMEANNILYLRDKGEGDNKLIDYRGNIYNSEEMIGKANAIVMFFGAKYMRSRHCLHELHAVLEHGNYAERIFPIILEDMPALDNALLDELYSSASLIRRKFSRGERLDQYEMDFANSDGYQSDIIKLADHLKMHNIPSIAFMRERDFAPLIEQLQKFMGEDGADIQPVKSVKTESKPKTEKPVRKAKEEEPEDEPEEAPKPRKEKKSADKSSSAPEPKSKASKHSQPVEEPEDEEEEEDDDELNGYTEEVNGVSFNMIFVEGGTFQMGSNAKIASIVEQPVHKVTLSNYYIGETPVTQALWKAVMKKNPSEVKGDDLPVTNISWDDAYKFIYKLNDLTDSEYRLPTEAEWEFAARGGNYSENYKYAGSNKIGDVAWYNRNTDVEPMSVAQLDSNELGIYDMSGNVREWCEDWYGEYKSKAQTDPEGPKDGDECVVRGGSFYSIAEDCRPTMRDYEEPDNTCDSLGFRLAIYEEDDEE